MVAQPSKATQRKTYPLRRPAGCAGQFSRIAGPLPQWLRPTLVVEVDYRQRLKGGLRHAALKGIGPDKKPDLIRRSPLYNGGLRSSRPVFLQPCVRVLGLTDRSDKNNPASKIVTTDFSAFAFRPTPILRILLASHLEPTAKRAFSSSSTTNRR